MKILLIGASGMIGSRVLSEALSRGHKVVAAARSPEKIAKTENVEAIALDANDSESIAAAAGSVDVIISATSPRSSGNPSKDALGLAKALIEAQQRSGKRVVVVGGAGTLHLPDGSPVATTAPEAYREEAKAMRQLYGLLVHEDIDFTLLAPSGMISPGVRTGTFSLGGRSLLLDGDGNSAISAEDYAVALIDEVETPKHFRTVFTVGY